MNNNIRNILAILVGLGIGSYISTYLIAKGPVPIGFDLLNMAENTKLFETKHFAFHIIAHSFATFIGAVIASAIAASYKIRFALLVGVLFLIGGVYNSFSLQYPILPALADLTLAYIPIAWIGGKLGVFISKKLDLDLNQDYYQ